MQTFTKPEGSTETRVKWVAYLFLLEEYAAELDAIINGPAAFGNPVLSLSERDWEFFMSDMLEPPEPNEALIKLFQDYGRSKE